MNLKSRILQLQPVTGLLTLALAVSTATGLSLLLLWSATNTDSERITGFAESLAAGLASLATEPLARKDRIHLGILANRLVDLPEIIGVTIYTVDNEMLALSGNVQRGQPFTQPIIADNGIIGYVRLHLPTSALTPGNTTARTWLSVLLILLIPLLVVLIRQALVDHLAARRANALAAQTPSDTEPDPVHDPLPVTHHLLTLNLFNQLSLTREQRDRELDHATGLATAVARLYHAEVSALPGTGLILDFASDNFDSGRMEGHGMHVVCAAFVLAQLLHNADSYGHYRLGGHVLVLNDDEQLDLSDPAVADAALLSALAREHTLLISEVMYSTIAGVERLTVEPVTNRLLDELQSIGSGARLISELSPGQRQMVELQVRQLSYSDDSTASESTF